MNAERIEVSLGKHGGTKAFETIQELEAWYVQEQSFWSWLSNQPTTDVKQAAWQRYSAFFSSIHNQINEVKTLKRNAEAAKQPLQIQQNIVNIKSFFSQCFEQQFCSYSGTPLAKFIEQIRKEENDTVAAAALAYSMRCQINSNQFESFKGALYGFVFETGIRERRAVELQALEELRLEWEKKFQTFRETLLTETDAHKKLNADAGELISKQEKANKGLLEKQESALNELVAKSQAEWNGLRKTYDDSLALRSPVTYWTKKAKSHLILSWIYAIVSMAAAGASLGILIPEVKNMMEIPKGVQEPEKWHPEYWRLAILIASGLFCVWVVRILVRLLLSNIHLQTDARERVTMVQTYLALLRRDKLKDDERMFILQTLFRPTPTGIVKDDGVPLTFVDAITKLRN